MENKKDMQKKVFNSIFDDTSNKNIENMIVNSITKEEQQKQIIYKKRSYNLPSDLLENIEKVVYVDRDIKDNTDLIIKALRYYFESKEVKALLEEYNTIKGGNL